MPLTDATVRSITPPEKGTTTVFDFPNFGLRVSHGGTKTWIVLLGKGRRHRIGHYPNISLANARKEARRILAEKELGQLRPDRVAFAKAKQDFIALIDRTRRPKTAYDYRRILNRHFAFDGSLQDVSPRQLVRLLDALKETPGEQRYTLAVGRAFFNWCVRQHYIDRSPMEQMRPDAPWRARTRVLSENELGTIFGHCLASAGSFERIVTLLILTGQRKSEIAALQWDWINEQERTITFPATATKNGRVHTIPYGDMTADLFLHVQKMVECPYVFPASRQRSDATTVFNGWSKAKAQLDRETGVTNYTIHDIRRSFATGMQQLGVRLEVTERLLNHISGTQSGIVGVYQRHHFLPEMCDAILRYEHYLRTLIGPTALV